MLIDDIMSQPAMPPIQGCGFTQHWGNKLECVVRADNVARLAEVDRRPVDDMPCLRAPFACMWVEWASGGTRCGCFWSMYGQGAYFMATISAGPNGVRSEGNALMGVYDDGAFAMFLSPQDKAGLFNEAVALGPTPAELSKLHGLLFSEPTPLGSQIIRTACLTVCLMHCKNVTAAEQVPPPALQKARLRRGKKPLFRYHVLNIEPMKAVLRKEGKLGSGSGIAQALHLCRGHFKDYRQSGLFGRVKGIFWWDHHVRGDKERGVVVKDYAVKAPAA